MSSPTTTPSMTLKTTLLPREFVYNGTIDVASIKIWLRHPAKQDSADTP